MLPSLMTWLNREEVFPFDRLQPALEIFSYQPSTPMPFEGVLAPNDVLCHAETVGLGTGLDVCWS
jgi:hypothetical protein